jgi:antitoxin VapB
MSLNIKNGETERIVRELVATTGESVTQAVTVAVRERLERLAHAELADARATRIRSIAKDAAPRWLERYRSVDHADLLYDEKGLPR